LKKRIAALALLASSHAAVAADLPSAGSQLQQIPSAPVERKAPPQFHVEQGSAQVSAPAGSATVRVDRLQITNATVFSQAELAAAAKFAPGSELTLSSLRGLAASIATFYRNHGYFLAQAFLPAQDIVDGTVTIVVSEGQYGKVVVRNESNLSDGLAHQLLDGLKSGDTVTIGPLESRLLQLADLPGVSIKSSLVPGASVGASDLIVDVAPGQRVTGSVDADNSGSRYTGSQRLGGTLNLNNPLGHGDVATLRALSSFDGLSYGRAAYQMQLGKADAGVAYTALGYELGEEFRSLDAHGTANVASVYGRYPLVRSRQSNLYAQLNFDAKTFRDRVDVAVPAVVTDKKAKVSMLSLVGDRRDDAGGGGVNTYSLTWTTGSLDIESPQALTTDAATARANGHYDKLSFSVMRLQRVTETVSLYAALQGQLAFGNLDVSEKMGLGGANAVRAYAEGEAYADQGYLLNIEARVSLPRFLDLMPGQLQFVSFLDTSSGRANRDPWDSARNRRSLSGGGVGLNWLAPGDFAVKASYARQIGGAVSTSVPDDDDRVWINAAKYF
jgi:hemolysin activation/secretion protein